MLKIFSGKPDDIQKRSSRELRVYDLLEQLQIAFLRVDHPHADTMQDCQEIDAAFHCTICKNLFLCNRQQTAFYLLMISGEKASQIAITSWTPSTRQSSCRFGQVHLQRLHPGFGIPEFFSEDSYTRSRYLRFVGL